MNTTQDLADSQKPTQSAPYTEAQVRRWLSFLARNMQQHEQTIFLIEQLQPSWLTNNIQLWSYLLTSRLVAGLLFTFIFACFGGLPAGLIFALVFTLIELLRRKRYRDRAAGTAAAFQWRVILVDSVIGLIVGLIFAVLFGFVYRWEPSLLEGLIVGLTLELIWKIRDNHQDQNYDIQTVETVKWSWPDSRQGSLQGVALGLLLGTIISVIGGLIIIVTALLTIDSIQEVLNLFFSIVLGFIFISFVLLICSLIFGLIGGLFGGISFGIAPVTTVPNQGIRQSGKNAVVLGGTIALIFGAIFQIPGGINGLIGGLIFGLAAGLRYGGLVVIQHYVLRLLLYYNGDTPLNYARFLDYTAGELHSLQKVGGGYIFVHRYLLEHFAEMAEEGEQST